MSQTVTCTCGKPMEVTDPIIEIVNQLSFSAIVVNHNAMKGLTCLSCGLHHFVAIQGFDMRAVQLSVMPIPAEAQKSSIITEAPAGFNPKRFH